ncbi:uncharacterized protein LOC110841589 [Folsomia candida]|uniref:uncharacterized protein LOC110841589 n=1 Tax=Folsomia candida TaxID=158441 RepID=UPI000B901E3A|nr:uncharacterized protein LOC110841589 [Folsomia candida]
MKLATAVSILALVAMSSALGEIGSDLISTLRIVNKLCYFPGDHSDPIAKRFADCYNLIPADEKEIFTVCQWSTFGVDLDTEEHIDVACKNPLLLPEYAKCLKTSFNDDAKMDASVLTINKCQGAIFGMK